jgi:hypothetical protein
MSRDANSTAQDRWEALLDGVLAERAAVVDEIVLGIREAWPVYRALPDDELRGSFDVAVNRVLLAARAHRGAADNDELAGLAELGRARLAQGVPVEQMLLAWRIGVQIVLTHTRVVADRLGIVATEMLEFVQSLIAWSDRAMIIVAAAHHHAELDRARDDQEARGEFVRGVLLGTLAPNQIVAQARVHGIDPLRDFIAIRARVDAGTDPAQLRRQLGFGETIGPARGLSAICDGDLVGFLPVRASSVRAAAVGVGPARPLARLGESFVLATRALVTLSAFGLQGPQRFEDLGLLPAVINDADVGDALVRRYVEPLAGSRIEIATSLRAWFACGMHIDRAAERLTLHANTLRYRLSRFEALTGADLRDPIIAFEVWWALQRAVLSDAPATAPAPR